MKTSELIKKLQDSMEKNGDIEVSVSCDQETHPQGYPQDFEICVVLWGPDPKTLMLCDRYTYSEIASD